jgi:regulator of PEP synthase PpsR (kinase-PPPase family)
VIDVTRRSVEETAAAIFQLLQARATARGSSAETIEGSS